MRIEAYSQVIQAYQTKKANAPKTTTTAKFRDQLNISNIGMDIQVGKQAVKSAPDVRQELVDEIKARMDAGTYSVTPEQFADKMIQKYEEMR